MPSPRSSSLMSTSFTPPVPSQSRSFPSAERFQTAFGVSGSIGTRFHPLNSLSGNTSTHPDGLVSSALFVPSWGEAPAHIAAARMNIAFFIGFSVRSYFYAGSLPLFQPGEHRLRVLVGRED